MFLPIVMAVYYLVPNGAKNIVLLLASLFFYAWGEPVYVVLMILSIVLNYFCGRDIEANADNPKKAKLSLVFALTANILILGFFKYYGFLLDTVNSFLYDGHSLLECSLCRSESHSIRFRRSHM